jgi:hypothetical protein
VLASVAGEVAVVAADHRQAGAYVAGEVPVGWAFALPASPLMPYLHGRVAEVTTPLLIGFGAIVFTSITASALQNERRRAYPPSQVPEAIRHLEEGHARGKVAITI